MSDEGILDVVENKGMVQIIIEIGISSKTFSQLHQAVLVSKSTVSNRLKEGRKTGLFEIDIKPTDHGTEKRHTLTENGEIVLGVMQELDFDSTVREYQRAVRQFDQGYDNLMVNLKNHRQLLNLQVEQIAYESPEEALPEGVSPEMFQEKPQEKVDLEQDLVGEAQLPTEDEEDESENNSNQEDTS